MFYICQKPGLVFPVVYFSLISDSESQSQNVTLQQPKTTTDKKKDSSPTPKLFKLTAVSKQNRNYNITFRLLCMFWNIEKFKELQ